MRFISRLGDDCIEVSPATDVEPEGVPIFSQRTLGEFEDASASIPLRQLDRAFAGANIGLGVDPGGTDGARRVQFRRYVASIDQHDPRQLDRLGDVLGALIGEIATSKQEFLVKAAERDGFVFAGGAFRPASSGPIATTPADDVAFIEGYAKRLSVIANDSPGDAIGGAQELVESVCRTVLRLLGKPAPGKAADLAAVAKATLAALALVATDGAATKTSAAAVRQSLQGLSAVVADLGNVRNAAPRHARLAVGAAVTFAAFVAETYTAQAAAKHD